MPARLSSACSILEGGGDEVPGGAGNTGIGAWNLSEVEWTDWSNNDTGTLARRIIYT